MLSVRNPSNRGDLFIPCLWKGIGSQELLKEWRWASDRQTHLRVSKGGRSPQRPVSRSLPVLRVLRSLHPGCTHSCGTMAPDPHQGRSGSSACWLVTFADPQTDSLHAEGKCPLNLRGPPGCCLWEMRFGGVRVDKGRSKGFAGPTSTSGESHPLSGTGRVGDSGSVSSPFHYSGLIEK